MRTFRQSRLDGGRERSQVMRGSIADTPLAGSMTDKSSGWLPLDRPCRHEGPAVYKIRLCRKPSPIGRLLKPDPQRAEVSGGKSPKN